MSEIEVPVISLKGFFGGDAAERSSVVAAVKEAALKCGFFMIKDHNANEKVIETAWKECRDFFDSPLSNKEEHPMSGEYPYGYSGLQGEIAGGSYEYGAADQKESFAVCLGPEAGADPRMPVPRWPSEPAHFKAAVTAYYREMETLARVLLRIFALALELPEDYFTPFEDKHWSALRCLNYPHSDKPFAPGQMRIAAHTDYGTLTILRADNTPGGLQLQMKDGSWRDVFIPPECFTINLGDLMQRWTNDLWKSTVHRVVPPPVTLEGGSAVDNRRQSVAFFHNLNRDAVCAVFPSCVSEAHPCKYEPINAFDHLMSRHATAIGSKTRLTSGKEEGEADAAHEAAKPAGGAGKVGGADITGAAWRQAESGAATGGAGATV